VRARSLGVALAGAALLLVPARYARAFPWSIDMFRGQSVQPLAVAPRNMPAGTMPVHGGELPMTRSQADGTLENPLQPTAAHLKEGKLLFETDCGPCHGDTGKGTGPVAYMMIIPPPDLTKAQPAERTDGYLYATIRNGSYIMPAYGDAMSPDERWEVVLYMRQLQGKLKPQ
jgi:mono/diheme cytochrome c family protein